MILKYTRSSSEILHLSSVDHNLSRLINTIGDYSLELDKNYYLKLVKSIVGQQLSIKAKDTIWSRIEALYTNVTPQTILNTDDASLRKAGLSFSKISYIKGLTEKVCSNEINLEIIDSLPNDDVIKLLTELKGIGNWTAEMFLIFSLGRLDVLSLDDVGIKRAIKWLYNFENTPTPIEITKISEPWKPFRSVASLYLWEIVNSGLVKKERNILFE